MVLQFSPGYFALFVTPIDEEWLSQHDGKLVLIKNVLQICKSLQEFCLSMKKGCVWFVVCSVWCVLCM